MKMSEEEKQAIENTLIKIENTQKGLDKGNYYGERFNLEQEVKREQTLLNLINSLLIDNEKLEANIYELNCRIKDLLESEEDI